MSMRGFRLGFGPVAVDATGAVSAGVVEILNYTIDYGTVVLRETDDETTSGKLRG
jgi:hypothetical protein